MIRVTENLRKINESIAVTARRAGRDPASITLVAVAKRQPLARIREAVAAGQRHFGENFVQEALETMAAFEQGGLIWHFIGAIQSNKTKPIAEHFAWVHTLDRAKIARRLNDQRPAALPPLQVCIQVNVDDEESKSGCAPEEIARLADIIDGLPRLRLRGLMCIPAPASGLDAQRKPFARLRELLEDLNRSDRSLDTLSMGMSADLEAAVLEGATLVRVGTDVFGPRPD